MPRAFSIAEARSSPNTSLGSSTFSSTVRHGKRTEVWNMTPTSRRGPLTRRPPTRISPVLGSSSPPISLSSVDLPQPLGPTKETNSPGWMSTLTARSASRPVGKTLLRALTAMAPAFASIASGRGGRLAAHVVLRELLPAQALRLEHGRRRHDRRRDADARRRRAAVLQLFGRGEQHAAHLHERRVRGDEVLLRAIHDRAHAFGAGAVLRPDAANSGKRDLALRAAVLEVIVRPIGAPHPRAPRL